MNTASRHGILAKVALFSAALIWGSSFIVVKTSVDSFTPNILLAFRFTIGCLLLCAMFAKKLKFLTLDTLWKGCISGLLLFAAYSVQTIGILTTTPGKNAFLTAIYCVIVPFMFWIVDKSKPHIYNFIAAIICIIGIGFVSLDGSLTIGFGDALTLIGGVLFAAHMVSVAHFGHDKDPVLFTIVQFGTCAVLSWAVGLSFEHMPTEWNWDMAGGMLFLAIFATAGALLLQNIGQKYTHPSSASIILSLESVFGVLFSVIIYGETLTPQLVIGFFMIMAAVIISETKLSFLRKRIKT